MKEMEEYTNILSPSVVANMEKIPNYQRKANEMFAFLEQHPVPEAWLKTVKNRDIKHCFEQHKSIEQIAELVKLPKAEVLAALEEMGLIEPVIG
jgi:hypothetical protein